MNNIQLNSKNEPSKDQTTKTIALVLLWTFIGSVAMLFITNMFVENLLKNDVEDDFRKGWFDLLKNALILLGTALTTVIGYYFGQREGAIKAKQAEKDIEETGIKADNVIKKVIEQRDEEIKRIIPKESDPVSPINPIVDESNSDIVPPT